MRNNGELTSQRWVVGSIIIDRIGDKMGCHVVRKRLTGEESSAVMITKNKRGEES